MANVKTLAGTTIARNLMTHAMVSLALVLPFIILELINGRNFPAGFPVALFGFIWLFSLSFILLLISIARSLRNRKLTSTIALLSKVVLLAAIASMWISLIVDQMPCFLGVPNCD